MLESGVVIGSGYEVAPAGAAGLRVPRVVDGRWSGWLWDRGDPGKDGDDVVDSGPGLGDSESSSAAAVGQPGGHVQQPVAQRFRFGLGQVEATLEEGEPDFTCAPLHSTVWYAVTLERNMAVTVDTAGSDYDTVVSVYRGSDFDDFDLVACNDDFTDLQARASFTAAADETFFVQVGAFGEAEFDSEAGQLQISFTRGTKKPTVFKSSFSGSLAFADWFSEEEDGFSETLVGLVDGRSKFGPGRPIAETALDLFHVTEEFDSATETLTVTEMFGFTTLDPNQFGIDRRLRSAFVDADLTLDGSRCVFTGDVDDGEGECESFTADVTVAITWSGEGGIVRDRFIERVHGDDFRVTLHFQGTSRDATADGSVTGEVDLVSGPAQFATIAKETSSVMEWFRNGSNLFF